MHNIKAPLVSVVIPAYNAENFLPESIESILGQTFADFELLILDDCSEDQTLKIAQDYSSVDSRIKVVSNDTNIGIGANRMLGVSLATGKFIAWLDADDIALPNRLASQIDFLENNLDVGVVGGAIQLFDQKGLGEIRRYHQDDAKLRKLIFRQNPVASPASTFRAEVFRVVGNYKNIRVCEDLEMLLRVGEKFKFGNVSEVVVLYRQQIESLTSLNLRPMEKAAISLRMRYASSRKYHFSFIDALLILFQRGTIWMPPLMRLRLFSFLRDG